MSAMLAKLVGTDAALPEAAGSLLVAGLTADSREVEPGFAFAALPGTKVDGAKYIGQAFARGASVVIANEGSYSGSGTGDRDSQIRASFLPAWRRGFSASSQTSRWR